MDSIALTFGRAAAAIGLVCLLVLSAAVLSDAFMRSVFNAPIFGLSDLSEIVTPVIVASCFPLALHNLQNITIRFLGRALPLRAGLIVELIGQTVALVILAGIAWQLGRYTAGLIEYGQYTWLLRIPVWPSWLLATAIMAVCVPVQALVLARIVAALREGRPLDLGEDLERNDADEAL